MSPALTPEQLRGIALFDGLSAAELQSLLASFDE